MERIDGTELPNLRVSAATADRQRREFGERLAALRMQRVYTYKRHDGSLVRRCLTVSEVAEAIGVTQPTVTMWENGKTSPPVYRLLALCMLYMVSPNYLLGYDNEH